MSGSRGRAIFFVPQCMKNITQDVLILSNFSHGFYFYFSLSRVLKKKKKKIGVFRLVTVTPRDRKAVHSFHNEITDLFSKEAVVQINDFPSLCLSPLFFVVP